MELVENLHPSDGVVCRKCGLAFRVSALDVDGGYLVSMDELECTPNFCPQCGNNLKEVDDGRLAPARPRDRGSESHND